MYDFLFSNLYVSEFPCTIFDWWIREKIEVLKSCNMFPYFGQTMMRGCGLKFEFNDPPIQINFSKNTPDLWSILYICKSLMKVL